jgi:Ca2+-binding EF-hand superfamily protein
MIHKTMIRTLAAMVVASLALSATAGTAHAQEPEARQAGGQWLLQRFDADGDGRVTLEEFQAAGEARFATLDADGDGRISAEEFAAARPEGRRAGRPQADENRPRRGLARMDADGDGYVSKAEFEAARMARFNALDANGNGVIDADEIPAPRGGRKGYGRHDCPRAPAAQL